MNKISAHKLRIGKFINPLSDFGFKRIFGTENGKDLLIDFLNGLLEGRKVIKDLTYNKNELQGSNAQNRRSIFDLSCTGVDGENFIIEVQRIQQQYFRDRAIFYASHLISNQAPIGRSWDYSLTETYFIGLMDFSFDDSEKNQHLHRVQLAYESGKVFYNKLEFIFLEIPKFVKTVSELTTNTDKWIYALKNLYYLDKTPEALKKGVFKKLLNMANVSNLSREEYRKYQRDMMAAWDEYAIKKTLEEKAKSAIAKGREEGREKGREEGLEKGKKEAQKQVVKNLLSANQFSISEIANFANVSESFVRKIKKEIKDK